MSTDHSLPMGSLARSLLLFSALGTLACSGSSGGGEPTLSFDATPPQLLTEAADALTIPLRLSNSVGYSISIDFRVRSSSTATPGVDFNAGPSPVVIPAGSTEASIVLEIVSDDLYEHNETIDLELSSESRVNFDSTRVSRTIINDDEIPEMSLEVTGTEFSEDSGAVEVRYSIDVESGLDSAATLEVGGDARPGVDFTLARDIALPAGQLSGTTLLTLINDDIVQGTRSLTLSLGDPRNVRASSDAIDLVILDDEEARVVELASLGAEVDEGLATTLVVTLPEARTEDVRVPLIRTGNAGSGDFASSIDEVVILAGDVSGTLEIVSAADTTDELDEEAVFTLGMPTGGAVVRAGTQFVLTILDDDDPPEVGLQGMAGATIVLDETAETQTVQFALSEISGKDVMVEFAVSGTATGENDVVLSLPGSQVAIPAGQSSVEMTVDFVDDFTPEEDEDLVIEIRPGTVNATVGPDPFVQFLIRDNDVEPEVAFLAERAETGSTSLVIADRAGTRAVAIVEPLAADVLLMQRSPDGDEIAFVADVEGDGFANLYRVDARGGEPVQVSALSDAGRQIDAVEWSPDSQRIAYVERGSRGPDELWVATVPAAPRLVFSGTVRDYVWEDRNSGMGYAGRLAFVGRATELEDLHLFVANPDGSSRARLTTAAQEIDESGERGAAYRWAPDGSRVAFRANEGARFELYTAQPDGSDLLRISGAFTHSEGHVREFAWSADAAAIAFRADKGSAGQFEIFASEPAERDQARSVSKENGVGSAHAFAWQPAGAGPDNPRKIAYVSDKDFAGLDDLWIVESSGRDGLNVSSVAAGGSTVVDFAWDAEGRRLAYTVGDAGGGSETLFTVRQDGTAAGRVSQSASPEQGVASFAWGPDGERLAYLIDLNEAGTTFELFSTAKDEADVVQLSGVPLAGSGVESFRWEGDATGVVYRADERTGGLFELFRSEAESLTGAPISGDDLGGNGVAEYDVR